MKKSKTFWIAVALFYAVFNAPNAMIIKTATNIADTYYWNFVRFLIVFIVCLPFMIKGWRQLTNKKVLPWVLGSAICIATSVITYAIAIQLSKASYVSIITLIDPILLVLIAPLFTKEHISRRAIAGVTLAALGAVMIMFVPIALYQSDIAFYPVATLLAFINCLGYTFGLIMIRRANEKGVPLTSTIGVNALFATIFSLLIFLLLGDSMRTPSSTTFFLTALYSGVGIALFSRIISVKIFENTGSAFTSALIYFETFLAVLLPILVLHETLSILTVIGGVLILTGTYVVESHRHSHAAYHFTWRHH